MVGCGRELGMRFKTEPACELDRAEHQVLRQLQWRGHGGLVIATEHRAAKHMQRVVGHLLRTNHVLDAKTERVDQTGLA